MFNPLPEGRVIAKTDVVSRDDISPAENASNPDATIADLAKDYTLFTHGVMMKYSGVSIDPLMEFYIQNSRTDYPKYFIFNERPLFSGLDNGKDKTWNHMLFGVPHEVWPDLALHLGTVTTVSKELNFYANCVTQKLSIFDHVAAKKTTTVEFPRPSVDIWSVSVESTRGTYCFGMQNFMYEIPAPLPLLRLEVPKHVTDAAAFYFSGCKGDTPGLLPDKSAVEKH